MHHLDKVEVLNPSKMELILVYLEGEFIQEGYLFVIDTGFIVAFVTLDT